METKNVIIIGYSGHAFVLCDAVLSMGHQLQGYCELNEKELNPFHLDYLGTEDSENALLHLRKSAYAIGVGDNRIRKKVQLKLTEQVGLQAPLSVIHSSAVIAATASLDTGVLVAANATINPLAQIGTGVIINTAAIIEHECIIGDFAHVAPGATLAGNVSVGTGSFIGANSVVKQGVNIGENVIVGAGCVIIKDIPDNSKVVGNPQRFI